MPSYTSEEIESIFSETKSNTMKLYVPEIGDHITLTEDWKFNLHAERRNEDLAIFFGHYLTDYNRWVDESILPRMRAIDYEVKYPPKEDFVKFFGRCDYNAYNAACAKAQNDCPEYVKYYEDYAAWRKRTDELGKDFIEVTIPAGTVLAIDRIYIRKGASDFSSITFFAKDLGEIDRPANIYSRNAKTKKKKALRFWAKLTDCNNINFEKYESKTRYR